MVRLRPSHVRVSPASMEEMCEAASPKITAALLRFCGEPIRSITLRVLTPYNPKYPAQNEALVGLGVDRWGWG